MSGDDPPPPETAELVEMLSKRREYLAALRERATSKRELAEELSTPRSTVDRAIRELEEAGLVERIDGDYRPTLGGKLALEKHESYLQDVDAIGAALDVTAPLPVAVELDQAMLVDAEVHESKPHAPDNALRPMLRAIREADRVRWLMPVALSVYVDVINDRVTNHGLDVELLCPPAVLAYLTSTYGESFAEAYRTGNLAVSRSGGDLPFGLCLATAGGDTHVTLITYTDNGVHGTITNDTEAAVGWAESCYRQYEQAAEPVEDPLAEGAPEADD